MRREDIINRLSIWNSAEKVHFDDIVAEGNLDPITDYEEIIRCIQERMDEEIVEDETDDFSDFDEDPLDFET